MFFLPPSKANLLDECPRCFYLEITKKAPRPRGIFPSLPSGVDSLIKERHDVFRAQKCMPPELNTIAGILYPDQAKLNSFRHWSGPQKLAFPLLNVTLRGGIDDLILHPDNTFSIFDAKSKASEPEDDYSAKYYQNQMDDYTLMMSRHLKINTSGRAYVAYYYLDKTSASNAQNGLLVGFSVKIHSIPVDPNKAVERINRAAVILKSAVPPAASEECEYCKFAKERNK